MGERQEGQEDLVVETSSSSTSLAPTQLVMMAPVAEHHAFRLAARARGVDEAGERVAADVRRRRRDGVGTPPRPPTAHRPSAEDDAAGVDVAEILHGNDALQSLRALRAAWKKGRASAAVETIAMTAPLSVRMWAWSLAVLVG